MDCLVTADGQKKKKKKKKHSGPRKRRPKKQKSGANSVENADDMQSAVSLVSGSLLNDNNGRTFEGEGRGDSLDAVERNASSGSVSAAAMSTDIAMAVAASSFGSMDPCNQLVKPQQWAFSREREQVDSSSGFSAGTGTGSSNGVTLERSYGYDNPQSELYRNHGPQPEPDTDFTDFMLAKRAGAWGLGFASPSPSPSPMSSSSSAAPSSRKLSSDSRPFLSESSGQNNNGRVHHVTSIATDPSTNTLNPVSLSPRSSVVYLQGHLSSSSYPNPNCRPQLLPMLHDFNDEDKVAMTVELMTEKQERQRWSDWAVRAAEKERERRVQAAKAFEENEQNERKARVQWAIDATHLELQDRLMTTYLSNLSATNWFNELVSSFSDDYEIVCPYYVTGCRVATLRSKVAAHIEVCEYRAREDAFLLATSTSGADSSEHAVVCPNTILGCSFSGSLNAIKEHLVTDCRHRVRTKEEEAEERAKIVQQVHLDVERERALRVLESQESTSTRITANQSVSILLTNQIQGALQTLHNKSIALWEESQTMHNERVDEINAIQSYLKGKIKQLWPFGEVELTGSSATGLSSSGLFENPQRSRSSSWESVGGSDKADADKGMVDRGDMDFVICFSDEMQHALHGEALLIQTLADHLRENRSASSEFQGKMKEGDKDEGMRLRTIDIDIKRVLPNARVPLIKAIVTIHRCAQSEDSKTKSCDNHHEIEAVRIPVDISMDGPHNTGVASTAMLKVFLRAFPPLGPVVVLLKEFLRYRGLNDTYTGGLGSYGLVLMVLFPLIRQVRRGGDEVHIPYTPPPQPNTPTPAAVRKQMKPTTGTGTETGSHHHQLGSSLVPTSHKRSGSFILRKAKSAGSAVDMQLWNSLQLQKDHGRQVAMKLLGLKDSDPDELEPMLKMESPICGVIIENCLRVYGEDMQCGKHGISLREGGFSFELSPVIDRDGKAIKEDTNQQVHHSAGDPMSIEDPIDVMNNVSKHCYRAVAIQQAFHDALEVFRGLSVRWKSNPVRAPKHNVKVASKVNGPKHDDVQEETPSPVAAKSKAIVKTRASPSVTALSTALSAALTSSLQDRSKASTNNPNHKAGAPFASPSSSGTGIPAKTDLLREIFGLTKIGESTTTSNSP